MSLTDQILFRCEQCRDEFAFTRFEQQLLSRIGPNIAGQIVSFSPPKQCPPCREQRRLAFRNERSLHYRTCDLTGARILTLYSPDKPYKVYASDAWWSDTWDETSFGQEYDFKRPFFDQFQELWRKVPLVSSFGGHNENSEYTNHCSHVKNCYLVFAANRNQDCLYSEFIWDSVQCVDCTMVIRGQSLWDCVSCSDCHTCFSCDQCEHSDHLWHCTDCAGSEKLFACAGLRKAKCQILNQPVSSARYTEFLANPEERAAALRELPLLLAKTPRLAAKLVRCEECSGHELEDSRNVQSGFQSFDVQDAMYIENSPGKVRDLLDISGATSTELAYQLGSVSFGYNLGFTLFSYNHLRDSFYTVLCHKGQHLFGCVGVRSGEFMILNRRYTEAQYFDLLPRVIAHLKSTGEWGEFFPMHLSPWAYNESAASARFPRSREQTLACGWRWFEADECEQKVGNSTSLSALQDPSPILANEVPDTVTKPLYRCQSSGKPFRIVPAELQFYRTLGLRLPVSAPNTRYRERLSRRLPNQLWHRECMNSDPKRFERAGDQRCSGSIDTPYAPGRAEIVFCEPCMQELRYSI